MPTFFNNCRRRDHVDLFGATAFFDLTRKQSDIAPGVQQECVVATYDDDGRVIFGWYSLSHESWILDPAIGEKVRVFFGKKLKSERLSKTNAAKIKPYRAFFNKLGNFKRQSTITAS
jgi:hypothetical protein